VISSAVDFGALLTHDGGAWDATTRAAAVSGEPFPRSIQIGRACNARVGRGYRVRVWLRRVASKQNWRRIRGRGISQRACSTQPSPAQQGFTRWHIYDAIPIQHTGNPHRQKRCDSRSQSADQRSVRQTR